jgi:NAD(P)H-hydrate repair Nnr-like enzyme with NAD(P)H-hydrate dehydratase domain
MPMGFGWSRYVLSLSNSLRVFNICGAHDQNEPEVVQGWKGVPRVILTPNIMEFKRLCEAKVCHSPTNKHN